MACEYCDGTRNLMHGNPEVLIAKDEYDGYVLKAVSFQEDRWFHDSVDEEPINFCPKCGRDLRKVD